MIGLLIALVIGFWLLKAVFKVGFWLLGLVATVLIGLFLIRVVLWLGLAIAAIGGMALLAIPFHS